MIQKKLQSIPHQPMTMPGADRVEMQLLCGPGDGCENFAMRKFAVAAGGCTPKHQHDYEHEIIILAGQGVAYGNGKENPIAAGDVLFIPAKELHQFKNIGPAALEFICMVPAFVHQPGGPAAAPVAKKAIDCGNDGTP